MFVTVIALKYAFLLVSQWSYGHFLMLTGSIVLEYHDESSPFNSTHYGVLYPQNGDRIVTTDSVTSLHPMYWHCWHSRKSTVSARLPVSVCPSVSPIIWLSHAVVVKGVIRPWFDFWFRRYIPWLFWISQGKVATSDRWCRQICKIFMSSFLRI